MGGWDIYISNMGNRKIPSLLKKKPTQTPSNPGKPNSNFNIKGVSLRQVLASELGKCSCPISWPTWRTSIPVGAIICLFSADFVSLLKGQVKRSNTCHPLNWWKSYLIRYTSDLQRNCTESRIWPIVFCKCSAIVSIQISCCSCRVF